MNNNDDGIYTINPELKPERFQQEAEGLLMSVVTSIDVLHREYSKQLTGEQQHFLKTMHNTMLQLFVLYDAVFPLQSVDARTYGAHERVFVLNPTLNKTKREDYLRGMMSQLAALCEEGLRTILLDYLNDRGGNLLMNAALQAQTLRHVIEEMQFKQPPNSAI